MKEVHIRKLEPSRHDADHRTLDGSNTVTLAPRKCRSTNRQVDPEVWFRIVHLAQVIQSMPLLARYGEQTVEVAIGPKGAFENGNIGALRLRAPPSRVVSAVPPSSPKPAREPKTPRVVELLRKAIEWQALLETGELASQAEIARREGITRARVTQVERSNPEPLRDGRPKKKNRR